MKKIILSLVFLIVSLLISPSIALAGTDNCSITCAPGQSCIITPSGQEQCYGDPIDVDDSIFGVIEAPTGVDKLNAQSESGIGLILFVSNIIKLITIIAGVWTMFNFIFAGFNYVTDNGKSGSMEKIGEKLTMSVIGLAIIVASYTIAAVIGLILFGDATFIINPQIPSAI